MRRDILAIGYVLLASFILLEIAFFKESPLITFRTAFAIAYMAMPGILLLRILLPKITTAELSAVGLVIGVGSLGIISYYLGLIGIMVWYHWILPLILSLIILGIEKVITINLKTKKTD